MRDFSKHWICMAQIRLAGAHPCNPHDERREPMGKTVKLTIRLSPEDMALLKSRSAKTRLSQSGYLRMLIRGYVPRAYPPELYFEVLQKLNQTSSTVTDPVIYRELLGALHTLQEAVTVPAKIEDI